MLTEQVCSHRGIVLEPLTLIVEFCARGSLADVLHLARGNPKLGQQLNWNRLLGIAMDAAKVRASRPLCASLCDALILPARRQLLLPLAELESTAGHFYDAAKRERYGAVAPARLLCSRLWCPVYVCQRA